MEGPTESQPRSAKKVFEWGAGTGCRHQRPPTQAQSRHDGSDRGGDRHEIRNTDRSLLQTVSVYVPPPYGHLLLPRGQRSECNRVILCGSRS
jgi:hypothetical protein